MKTLFLLITVPCLSASLYAQTGPGGIGKTDGSSTLEAWYRADMGTYQAVAGSAATADSDPVGEWQDQSGNGKHISGSFKPALRTGSNGIGNQNALEFSNDNLNGSNVVNSSTAASLFIVLKPASSALNIVFEQNPGNSDFSLENVTGLTPLMYIANQGAAGPSAMSSGTSYITGGVGGSGSITVYLNGSGGTAGAISGNTGTGALHVGSRGGGAPFSGLMAEIIAYSHALNGAERILVDNYLSAKYGISLSANDKYTEQSGYIADVAGIGKESSGSSTLGNSGGLLIEENNTSLADGEYVMAGHNSGSSTTAADVAGSTDRRYGRIWYIAKSSGASVDTKVAFDFSEIMGGGTPANASNYVLLYRSGTSGNFSSVTVTSTAIQNTDQVVFEVANANLSDGYYTLGTDDAAASPLPVEIISFAGKRVWEGIELDWMTASELNNDYFEIQRSEDGVHFTRIGTRKGKGTTNEIQAYQFVDKKVSAGRLYYRLLQFDFNGEREYSRAISVAGSNKDGTSLRDLYPNPVAAKLSMVLQSAAEQPVQIRIINYQGICIKEIHKLLHAGIEIISIDVSSFPKGIYLASVLTGSGLEQRSFVKQ